MQVYAIVYCSETNEVLVCKKKRRGYFFQRRLPRNRSGQPLRGGGKYCFPGGRKNDGESSHDGAVREFREETGVDLSNAPIIFELKAPNKYIGVVFGFGRGQFQNIFTTAFVNINRKQHLINNALGVNNGLITALPQEITDGSVPIEDDELEFICRNYLQDCKVGGIFIQNDNATGWFYEMCEKLKGKEARIINGMRTMPDWDLIDFRW